MVNRRHLFQTEDAVLDRIISSQTGETIKSDTTASALPTTPNAKALVKRKTLQHDLPYYTTHLLISAYLASYNPSRTDTTYFMKHTDKRKNKRKVYTHATKASSKHRRISRHLLTPSPFPLDRLLAIFRSLLEGPVPQLADIYTQIATLTSMRLLVRVGGTTGADPLDPGARWRVNFGWEWVRGLGRSVGIEVGEYLVGGVDG
jgi:origin recognition complex subunit 5